MELDSGDEETMWTEIDFSGPTTRYLNQHYDALTDLWHTFLNAGRMLFGSEFHSHGGFDSFVHYMYMTNTPP